MLARQVMTSPVVIVRPDTPIEEAARLLTERRISALPVVDEVGPVGIVSEADLIELETNLGPRTQATPTRRGPGPYPLPQPTGGAVRLRHTPRMATEPFSDNRLSGPRVRFVVLGWIG